LEVLVLLERGTTCWRIEEAEQAAIIIDMAEYFTAVRAAMLAARRSVHLINWAFDPDTLFHPQPGGLGRDDERIGPFLKRLAEDHPELDIRVLCWKASLPISATQNFFTVKARRCFADSRVKFHLDGCLPFGAAHHQKMIIVDDHLAFCGSADIGPDRWDTVRHQDDDPRRIRRNGKCYESRHELMMALQGPPALALGELFRERWRRATGEVLAAAPPAARGSEGWPAGLKPRFRGVTVGISRTQSQYRHAQSLRESEALFLAMIAKARRRIYLENQYMTSPIIAEALAARLSEADGPEVILISTLHCPSWFDQMTMDRTRSAFIGRLELANAHRRLHAYCPLTSGGRAIIVHAKVAIIDDDLLRIGSTNLNNRSCGFDTECDVTLEATGDHSLQVRREIARIRSELVAHWLGSTCGEVERAAQSAGGLGAAIGVLQSGGPPRLKRLTAKSLGPVATFIASHHIGDPIGPADAWRPWRRRRDMDAALRKQQAALAQAGLPAPPADKIREVT
jgi:phosphatidylserine/phosphatidylglycerophosphate/cardiolipin synthase-like enzyme